MCDKTALGASFAILALTGISINFVVVNRVLKICIRGDLMKTLKQLAVVKVKSGIGISYSRV